MGKAARWIRGLLGMKKGKENVDNNSNCSEKKEKKRWSFAKSGKDSEGFSRPMNSFTDSEKEQNKHAIAVAAATAAAADAAVAAAQAAVAVVRLTSQGRGAALFASGRERRAAEKIQAVFRGFLARKALRALKGLVKLQALIRGYLIRKRAAATLYSMQALIRAQSAVRSQARLHRNRFQPEIRSRKSTERFEEFHSKRLDDESPKIVEIDTCGPKSRSRRLSSCTYDYNYDQYYQAATSPLPCPGPNHSSIPDHFDWGFIQEEYYKFATAQNTPRFGSSGRANAPPITPPPKSVCGDGFFRPNYMTNTQSFSAKVRSQSAPKQRPESGPKRRVSLNEVMSSRSSFSGVRMQKRSCSQLQEGFEC